MNYKRVNLFAVNYKKIINNKMKEQKKMAQNQKSINLLLTLFSKNAQIKVEHMKRKYIFY